MINVIKACRSIFKVQKVAILIRELNLVELLVKEGA